MLRGLIDQTARVPWDDRPARTRGWRTCAKIEVVHFPADRASDVQQERVFRGSLLNQARDCLAHLENLSLTHLQKQPDSIYARTWSAYPIAALREALMNAIYHRSYDIDQLEPIKIYVFADRVEVISYPGPVAAIQPAHLLPGAQANHAVQARNRRIGELLKELGLAEGRLSGLPKMFSAMEQNGSPRPRFDFDADRTYFRATFQTHPQYGALSAMRDAAHLRTVGNHRDASRRLADALAENRASPDAPQMLRELAATRADEDGAAPSLAWGVDGCKSGWFYIALDATGEWCCGVVERLHEVVERAGMHDRLLVDIPIGLPDNEHPEPRRCDLLARSELGKPHSSSVFPAPARETLQAQSFSEAGDINQRITGKRVTKQTYSILAKVGEADELLRRDKRARAIVREAHPELCFWALKGMQSMKHSKKYTRKKPEGHEERLSVLEKCWPGARAVAEEVSELCRRKDVALDDIADAMVAAVTARADALRSFPDSPPLDGEGLPMQMVWALRDAIRFE